MSYEYDLVGNITKTYDNSDANTSVQGTGGLNRYFDYDSLYRLTSATGRETDIQYSPPYWDVRECLEDYSSTRSYTEEYTYDLLGNLTYLNHLAGADSYSREYVLTSGDDRVQTMKLAGGVNINFDWDGRGNLLQESTERFFVYNNLDKLVAFRNQAGMSEPTIFTHYLYDGAGNRVKKLTRKPGNKSEVAVYAMPGFEHRYVKQTGTGIDATRNYNIESCANGTIRIGADIDDSTPPIKYVISDHLGSASIQLTNLGALINREEYLPYGQTSFGGYLKKKYRYTGKEKDEESGLYYYGARYYAPWMCRFMSVDPLYSKNLFFNPFHYCSCNPINRVDPTGMNDDDYRIFNDGKIVRTQTIDSNDNFFLQNNDNTFNLIPNYSLPRSFIPKGSITNGSKTNTKGFYLVPFPANGVGFNSYSEDTDRYIQPPVAAVLFGATNDYIKSFPMDSFDFGNMSNFSGNLPNGHPKFGWGHSLGLATDLRFFSTTGTTPTLTTQLNFSKIRNQEMINSLVKFGMPTGPYRMLQTKLPDGFLLKGATNYKNHQNHFHTDAYLGGDGKIESATPQLNKFFDLGTGPIPPTMPVLKLPPMEYNVMPIDNTGVGNGGLKGF